MSELSPLLFYLLCSGLLMQVGAGRGRTHNHRGMCQPPLDGCFPVSADLHGYLAVRQLSFRLLSFIFPKATLLNCTLYSIFSQKTCCLIEKIEIIRSVSGLPCFFSSTLKSFIKIQSLLPFYLAAEREVTLFTSEEIMLFPQNRTFSVFLKSCSCLPPLCHLQSPLCLCSLSFPSANMLTSVLYPLPISFCQKIFLKEVSINYLYQSISSLLSSFPFTAIIKLLMVSTSKHFIYQMASKTSHSKPDSN